MQRGSMPALLKNLTDLRGEIGLCELLGADVDAERQRWIGGKELLPGTELLTGVEQQLAIDGQDNTGLVGERE